jgi:hypothetical protein
MINECTCEVCYSISPHGDDYALFYGRCDHRHGYNLANIVEAAFNFDPKHLELLINLGSAVYKQNPDGGHLAE